MYVHIYIYIYIYIYMCAHAHTQRHSSLQTFSVVALRLSSHLQLSEDRHVTYTQLQRGELPSTLGWRALTKSDKLHIYIYIFFNFFGAYFCIGQYLRVWPRHETERERVREREREEREKRERREREEREREREERERREREERERREREEREKRERRERERERERERSVRAQTTTADS